MSLKYEKRPHLAFEYELPKQKKRKRYFTAGDNFVFISKLGDNRYEFKLCDIFKSLNSNEIKLQLTEEEQDLFNLLNEFVYSTSINTIMRVAGGWVRDKLLNKLDILNNLQHDNDNIQFKENAIIEHSIPKFVPVSLSKDIDIAIDNMSGKSFAEKFDTWLQQKYSYPRISIGIIAKDPDKSKHLETATLKYGEFSLDIVNLRTETYTKDSRIPIIKCGLPEEDALRRDFTINSMFYNINNGKLEDFTKKGLEDLYNQVLRTPLDPIQTLLDDPLRVLRAFRFAARLHFRLDNKLLEACSNPALNEALATKVSRERIGAEVHEMVTNLSIGNPAIGLRMIINSGLADSVFKLPNTKIFHYNDKSICVIPPKKWYELGPFVVEICHRLIELSELKGAFKSILVFDKCENWVIATYGAFCLPLAEYRCTSSKDKETTLVKMILTDSLKLPNRISDAVSTLLESFFSTLPLISNFCNQIPIKEAFLQSKETLINSSMDQKISYSRGMEDSNQKESSPYLFDNIYKNKIPLWSCYQRYIKQLLNKSQCRRVELGLFVLHTGKFWLETLFIALANDLVQDKLTSNCDNTHKIWTDTELTKTFEKNHFALLMHEIFELDLQNVWNMNSLINGEILMGILPKLSKGPIFKDILDTAKIWSLAFPNKSRFDCELFLKTLFKQYA
ncbi:poly polymerase family protein [Cryptosporidium andersoni]|uniref:Poly polymerase family protein n=1 Tax=Cryptosporidium andersoni TaxID=117008 RepID=A0A1J4MUF5_9CRYT|nr:poly polymerase family protein [Cryptosporidium andersoni]